MPTQHAPQSRRCETTSQRLITSQYKSAFRYPGGKSRFWRFLGPALSPLLEASDTFLEPFVGGGSVAVRVALEHRDMKIILADKNPFIAAFWQSLEHQRDADRLCAMVADCKPTVDLWQQNRELMAHADNLDTTQKAFCGLLDNRLSRGGYQRGGVMGGKSQTDGSICQRWTPLSTIRRIQALHLLFAGRLVALCADANEVISAYPTATKFFDPPYYEHGRELYLHAFGEKDHRRLADTLYKHDAWVLTYDDVKPIWTLYAWANIRTIEVPYDGHTRDGQSRYATELLIQPRS